MNTHATLIRLSCAVMLAMPAMAHAQHAGHGQSQVASCMPEHAAMGHCAMPAADHDHHATSKADDAPSCTPDHAAMGHCTMPAKDHDGHASHAGPSTDGTPSCTPEHAAMGHCEMPPTDHGKHAHNAAPKTGNASPCTPEHAAMGHCTLPEDNDPCPPEHAAIGHCTQARRGMQEPREPIPPVTDEDRAAAFPVLRHPHMSHGPAYYTRVLFNRFEAWGGDHGNGQAWEGSASIGGDIHRLWLLSEGGREEGRTTSSSLEVLYGRGMTPWWDVVAGIRHDFRPVSSQTRAAIGIQGMAPHFFELSAMAYLGESGRLTAALEVEYELLLTNRLILQPLLELEFNSKDDPLRRVGSGLGKTETGLRLRYEVDRRFAPYIGFVHERSFGATADFRHGNGQPARDNRWVAGIRFWF